VLIDIPGSTVEPLKPAANINITFGPPRRSIDRCFQDACHKLQRFHDASGEINEHPVIDCS